MRSGDRLKIAGDWLIVAAAAVLVASIILAAVVGRGGEWIVALGALGGLLVLLTGIAMRVAGLEVARAKYPSAEERISDARYRLRQEDEARSRIAALGGDSAES